MRSWEWATSLSDEEWTKFLSGTIQIPDRIAPPLPPEEFQRSWVGRAGEPAIDEAMCFVRKLKSEAEAAGAPVHRSMRVLDFACGWGRFYRVLMRDFDEVIGADPDADCLQLCREALPCGNFVQIGARPPYSIWPHGHFDLVIAYSIFTHLAQPLAARILDEIAWLLRPGGLFAFTTLPMFCIDIWDRERSSDVYRHALARTDFEPVRWKARAEAGEFLYIPAGGAGSHMTADLYGWALISRPCLERMIAPLPFTLISMGSAPGVPQEFVLLRRG
jgi:SAM-dependent methyltransferase